MPAVEVKAPPRSNRPGWRSDSVMYRGTRLASRMPMGTLTNSTQRHDSHEVSIPPASRPRAPPAPATAPKTPKARLRSGPSAKLVVTRARAVGAAMAPPTPWRALAASSQPAQERGQGEHQDPGDEHPAAAQDVAGPAAQQEQAAEGQGVGVQHPRQVGGGEPEG